MTTVLDRHAKMCHEAFIVRTSYTLVKAIKYALRHGGELKAGLVPSPRWF